MKDLDAGQGLASPSLQLTQDELAATRERIDGPLYLDLKTRKYVLLRLDEALAKGSGVVCSHSLITVEHVLPQNPKANSQWLADFTDDERQFWTHRLGNLVLLNRYKNAEAQNHDFAKKKATYFTGKLGVANFALTAQVVSANSWTPTTLAARQGELIGELCSAWEL
ncbi:HNH endonuclease family protein [Streptomyces sp. H10-C2]|uniref:HNH endonuclease family protein n=1 Tax=unclassified Streptomyces TaxID=2593676 RepID=UPI0024B9E922|nr:MULTISPECIES: HNH endonuclease family protein [unclassified Streptomyces]MDJ0345356.1 HNH endonuclease family protein [Streptomyces sp. PH10-H1]MDJ0374205.1 HNH endonuclease family protein [Streptomyces sp. H10-C2]